MIANEEQVILDPLPPCSKLLVIGDTRAEIFISSLNLDYRVYLVDNFCFADQFLLVSVRPPKGKNKRSTMLSIARAINANPNQARRTPCLLLTGSRAEQENVARQLKGNTHLSRDEDRSGQIWNYGAGCTNIFYTNSIIARGIDIEFYHLMIVYNTGFANPYWSTLIDVAKSEGDYEGLKTRKARFLRNPIVMKPLIVFSAFLRLHDI